RSTPGLKHGADVFAVERHAWRKGYAGHGAEGWEEINAHGNGIVRLTCRNPAGLPCNERHAKTAVPAASSLSVAKTAGRAFKPGTVIGSKDDQGVAIQAELSQLGQELANDGV